MVIATILFDFDVLQTLKDEMLPSCMQVSKMAMAVALLGTLWAISTKVFGALANADPIDYYSMLKPLAVAMCIGSFDVIVIGTLDGIVRPICEATSGIAKAQVQDTEALQDILDKMIDNEQISEEEVQLFEKLTSSGVKEIESEQGASATTPKQELSNLAVKAQQQKAAIGTVIMSYVTEVFSSLLLWITEAASMGIGIVGTFFLIILTILGPLAFAASSFPAFDSSISSWLARYISISLWIPICDLFGAMMSRVQSISIQHQISTYSEGAGVSGLLSICVSIVAVYGLLSVPTIAGWIIQSGGTGSYSRNLSDRAEKSGKSGTSKSFSGFRGGLGGAATALGNPGGRASDSISYIKK